jgi:hypothetical protein
VEIAKKLRDIGGETRRSFKAEPLGQYIGWKCLAHLIEFAVAVLTFDVTCGRFWVASRVAKAAAALDRKLLRSVCPQCTE